MSEVYAEGRVKAMAASTNGVRQRFARPLHTATPTGEDAEQQSARADFVN
jgi:hypothetical protein